MTHTAYITHPDCLLHDNGITHPERPQRLRVIREALLKAGLMDRLHLPEAPEATDEQLARVHTRRHIEHIRAQAPGPGQKVILDADTSMNEHSLSAALRAAGAAVEGVRQVIEEEVDSAFCAVRPPGHHAERDRAMGFCLFNNIAVGAAHALEHHGLSRVAIADFDVHHGNGTEDIFRDDPRVLYCSSFQHPFYPGLPLAQRDHLVHTPLPEGTDGPAFREALRRDWLPALEAFRPELVLISAGFDAHHDDFLAGLALWEDDYAWITRQLMDVAARHAGGRVVSVLEGGYDLESLAHSVRAHVCALLAEDCGGRHHLQRRGGQA